jgi:hypothetical protein
VKIVTKTTVQEIGLKSFANLIEEQLVESICELHTSYASVKGAILQPCVNNVTSRNACSSRSETRWNNGLSICALGVAVIAMAYCVTRR